MLDNFRNTINKLEAFDFGKELETIVEDNKETLADLQAEQWASQSKDRFNKDITLEGSGYSPFTVRYKKEHGTGLGAVTSRVTLFQTGTLYRELFATIKSSQFTLESTVPYFTKLIERTGEDATGLNEESRLTFAESKVLPGIDKALREKTGLKLK